MKKVLTLCFLFLAIIFTHFSSVVIGSLFGESSRANDLSNKKSDAAAQVRSAFVDSLIVLTGGSPDGFTFYNNVITSSEGKTWKEVVNNAPWQGRSDHTATYFNNDLYVMGGEGRDPLATPSYQEFNDVWKTSDGLNWTLVTEEAAWSKRLGHSSVVFNNQLYVIGGTHFQPPMSRFYYNDVWRTSDGENWEQLVEHADWLPRGDHSSLVFDNKIWVIGGHGSYGEDCIPGSNCIRDDIWSSTDGVHWNRELERAPWSQRYQYSSTVFDGKMWMVGGGLQNVNPNDPWSPPYYDVWSSSDGVHWTQVADRTPWPVRRGGELVAYKDKMLFIGGYNWGPRAEIMYTDVWSSADGVNWSRIVTNIPNLQTFGFKATFFPQVR